jgi:MFS family permease
MALRQEVAAVYGGGMVQGIVLVTFPAIAPILKGPPPDYGLGTEYGTIFVPQAIMAVLTSLLGAGLTRLIGGKRVLLIGLAADLLSMLLLYGSTFVIAQHGLAFGMLLAATTCLGIGFGFAVPALNTFTAAFFPTKVDQAILTLNALLGLGTALAPVIASIFVGLGFWYGLPLLMSVMTAALIVFTLRLPLRDATVAAASDAGASAKTKVKLPARFWLYAAFALFYGICESLNGSYCTLFMSENLVATTTISALALTVFWAVVTGGRILFAAIGKWCPEHLVFRTLPVLIAAAFILTSLVPTTQPMLGLLAFGLAGLGCSALLPLIISFCQGEFTALRSAMAGAMIGLYQIGYGGAGFGVGPLESAGGLNLVQIFRAASGLAALLAVVAFVIIAGRPKTARG